MKFLACIVLALAVGAFADELPQKDKRATFALGYGAYPYGAYPYHGGYGSYPYVRGYNYPYSTPFYGTNLPYATALPVKTEVVEAKDAVTTKTVPAASTLLPYSSYGAYPYSAGIYNNYYGAYPYAAGAYQYSGYPYNYGYYGFAGKLIK